MNYTSLLFYDYYYTLLTIIIAEKKNIFYTQLLKFMRNGRKNKIIVNLRH